MNQILKKIGVQDESFELLTVRQLIAEEILEKPLDGNHGEIHPKGEDFVTEGVPFIMATDVNNGQVDYESCNFITAKQADSLRKGFARNGDVLVTHKGTIGRTAILKYEKHPYVMLTPQVTYYRVKNRRRLDNHYLRHYFDSELFQKTLHLWADSGSTRAYLGIIGQQKLPILVPPIGKQRKIAGILSAHDELIQNNKRRIALLEKLAAETYREWFVRFRFPGHEKVKKIKGVPDGWEVRRISEVVNFLSGYSFKSGIYTPSGELGIVTIKNVQDGYFIPECTDFIDEPPANMRGHCVLNAGDVLMSLTGNVGRVCHVYGSNLLLNQRVAKLESRLKNGSQFAYYTFNNRSMIQLIENLSLGSTAQMNLSPIQLGKQKLVVPDPDLLERFENAIQPLTSLKLNLYNQCESLRNARDGLLHRLISGKLSVENLDIQFPPSMMEELNADLSRP